ncbi:hypothetical protein EMPS_03573 [Entomortierella parvispora]|uniref:CUE domain-containing protein n=1 Tax=Entomortierella parvispora TaxID=205924 RepID=A0A9P3H720_9FUNG|nr:hypothetical protein EMPS_03573 [Entomortierella parvispora]
MSSADKDKTPEADPTVSDLTALEDEPVETTTEATTTTTTTTTTAKPKSPQETNNIFDDDEDEDDLEVHPAVPTTAAAPVATTVAPTTTATATAPAPTAAPVPAGQSEREAKLAILTEAFPTVEKEVCEFVLESHRGNVEASINALLEISDPEFQAESPAVPPPPAPTPVPATAPAAARLNQGGAPALPRRQGSDGLSQGVANMNLGGQPHEIDPILLASTSTPEQQLRADEDFARTLAAMDEYRARDRQNIRGQQQQQPQDEGPSFATEFKELMDEELPKIKERFNVAADTTKKKVTEWYNQFKASRAESAAQRQNNMNNQAHYDDGYRSHPNNEQWESNNVDRNREPIRFGSNLDDDEPLARNRVTPPLDGARTPPLPSRPYNTTSVEEPATTNTRRTTVEEALEFAMNAQPIRTSGR